MSRRYQRGCWSEIGATGWMAGRERVRDSDDDDNLAVATNSIRPRRRSRKQVESVGFHQRWSGEDGVVFHWRWRYQRAAARSDPLPKNKTGSGSACPCVALHCHFKKSKRVSEHTFPQDAFRASARTLSELILLSISPPKPLCFE